MAKAHLEARGLRLVQRNYRCPRGEIDLIMREGEMLVFVEVRYRRGTRFGSGAESVDRRKQARLIAAATDYLQRHGRGAPARFDVVAIGAEPPILNWIADAFRVD